MGDVFASLELFIQSAKTSAANAFMLGTAAVRQFLDRLDAEADGVVAAGGDDEKAKAEACLNQLNAIRASAAATSASRTAAAPAAFGPGVLILINLAITLIQEWLKSRQTP